MGLADILKRIHSKGELKGLGVLDTRISATLEELSFAIDNAEYLNNERTALFRNRKGIEDFLAGFGECVDGKENASAGNFTPYNVGYNEALVLREKSSDPVFGESFETSAAQLVKIAQAIKSEINAEIRSLDEAYRNAYKIFSDKISGEISIDQNVCRSLSRIIKENKNYNAFVERLVRGEPDASDTELETKNGRLLTDEHVKLGLLYLSRNNAPDALRHFTEAKKVPGSLYATLMSVCNSIEAATSIFTRAYSEPRLQQIRERN